MPVYTLLGLGLLCFLIIDIGVLILAFRPPLSKEILGQIKSLILLAGLDLALSLWLEVTFIWIDGVLSWEIPDHWLSWLALLLLFDAFLSVYHKTERRLEKLDFPFPSHPHHRYWPMTRRGPMGNLVSHVLFFLLISWAFLLLGFSPAALVAVTLIHYVLSQGILLFFPSPRGAKPAGKKYLLVAWHVQPDTHVVIFTESLLAFIRTVGNRAS